MSLDETHEALTQFASALSRFDERLRVGRAQLREKHAVIDGIWTDALRQRYDVVMDDLDRQLSAYADSHSEQFEAYLQTKIAQLRFYLSGE